MQDIEHYHLKGRLQFGVYSWLAIAQAIGVVDGKSTVIELFSLSKKEQDEIIEFANDLNRKISPKFTMNYKF